MAKRRRNKLNPNRFQKVDDNKLFSFDPVRRYVLKWGVIAGGVGGLFIILSQNSIFWQILGIFTLVMISNYHIGKASQRIPRLHATLISMLGVTVALIVVISIGTLILAFLQSGGTVSE